MIKLMQAHYYKMQINKFETQKNMLLGMKFVKID